jgi:CDP-6-deoxy-D-xylo-4-hexulose-3-dehydrase
MYADLRHVLVRKESELIESSSTISEGDFDNLLRQLVRTGVERYYRATHKKKTQSAFAEGARVPYAGRVFDHSEMLMLTEASLDFWLTSGRFSDTFEREFASRLGVRFAALVNSGSSANLLAFSSLTSELLGEDRIRAGDEVITVAAGFPTTVSPIFQTGCTPVFVDVTVDDGTYNIDTEALEAAITDRTRAVMVAHTLGNPINLDVVGALCEKHDLWLVEDNCDALGSRYRNKLTGTFGDIATSSFYPPHHLTMGEGGAVYSNNVRLRKIVESLRDWGRDCWCPAGKDNTCGKRFCHQLGTLPKGYDHKYIYRHFGYNLKATDLQAAIGCAQLDKLDSFVEARRRNWQELRDGLANLQDFFVLPEPTPHSAPSWFGFLLTVRDDAPFTRNALVEHLELKNIQTRMLFAGNLLRHPLFDELRSRGGGYRVVGDLRNSDRILEKTFWVGVYPGLKPGMTDYMIQTIRDFALQSR